jgi:hypothetical protein
MRAAGRPMVSTAGSGSPGYRGESGARFAGNGRIGPKGRSCRQVSQLCLSAP